MPLQTSYIPPSSKLAYSAQRPAAAEIVQRWSEGGGIEDAAALEWMLDRVRPSREALT